LCASLCRATRMHSSLSRARSASSALAGARVSSKSLSRGARSLARTRVGVDPQHAFEVATSAFDAVNLDLSLSEAEEALGKSAFAALSVAGGVFGGKVRARRGGARDAREEARGRRACAATRLEGYLNASRVGRL